MHTPWRDLAQIILWTVMFFAGLVLIGGYMDWMVLKGTEPGDVKIASNTAFCLLLSSTAAVLFGNTRGGKTLKILAFALSVLVFLIGALTLIQFFSGWNLGVDQLLFANSMGAVLGGSRVCLTPLAAFNFVLVGGALILQDVKAGANLWPSQILLIIACLLSQMTIIGYAYGVPVLYQLDQYAYIASPNGLAFLLLCGGILLLRPERGLTAILVSEGAGGRTARTLLPACVILPVVLGSLRQAGAKLGGADIGLILLILSVTVALPSLIYWNAKKLDELDQTRNLYENDLRKAISQLASSNRDLEEFAFIASHDLKEPLRGVGNAVSLLKKRCEGKLDGDAVHLIDNAVDGARRMHQLIDDLLFYSRLESQETPQENLDAGQACRQAIANLQTAIMECGAKIEAEPLPELKAGNVELVALFQNLIANGIKFRGKEAPSIRISAKKENEKWLFSVADNGIGIDMNYKERIFEIFKQLHSKGEYTGTGIGLAVCKKIVERLGGAIWVESEPGKGAVFYFTLPVTSLDNGGKND